MLPIDDTQPTMISTTARAPASTSSAPTSLTLSDIRWLDSNIHAIHLNETDYMIARNQTVSRSTFKTILNYFSKTQKTETDLNYFVFLKSDDNEGYECNNSVNSSDGNCRHLQSCVLPAFTTDRDVLVNSYFCGIQSKSLSSMYLGVCCPSTRRSSNQENP